MTDKKADRLRKLDTCAVSDACDRLGLKGAALGLHSVSVPARIAGRVQTVLLGPASDDIPKRHLCTSAIEAAGEGDVIVIQNHTRPDAAGWGGILSLAAKTKGLSGTICDGPVRDVDESTEFGLPVFARSKIPSTARGRIAEHAWNVEVEIGGVAVKPGDLVLADGSGVVFVTQDREDEILDTAEEIAAKESAMAAAVRAGKPVSQVMGGDYESMLIGGKK